jgi:prepilin signal peptidase PulO-like enzyme (type II secretory pathway)
MSEENAAPLPYFPKTHPIIPLMLILSPGNEFILTLGISLSTVLWLSICAFCDARTHHVPNWLTLPAIPLALLASWLTRENRPESLSEYLFHLLILTLPLFVAWSNHLIGGADLKILLALSLVSPLLVIVAWAGVLAYFMGLSILEHHRPTRFTAVPGFALGIGVFTLGQLAVISTRHMII